jgi:Protein of unknown function (DUF3054)
MSAGKSILLLGDIFTFAIFTFIGFAAHGEADLAFIPRMGTTFFPLLIGWFLIAPWLDLFDGSVVANPKLLWRIPTALFFIAPLAVILRAALLHSTAQPVFALVLGAVNAIGMLVWRGLYLFIVKQNKI